VNLLFFCFAVQQAAMSCDWEGNRRSRVALAMHHVTDLNGLSTCGLKADK